MGPEYCEVSGLNFAISSRETSWTNMEAVCFDWLKSQGTLDMYITSYDGSKKYRKNTLAVQINGNVVLHGGNYSVYTNQIHPSKSGSVSYTHLRAHET